MSDKDEPNYAAHSRVPFVITLGQFEEAFKALPSKRAFIFAKYKGKWRKVIAEFNRGNIIYYFFNDSNVSKNRLMSEHFTMVSVPQKPDAL